MSTHTVVTDPAALDAALLLARGSYQRGLLLGQYALSGAGLKGAARRWGARYAASRGALLSRLTKAGVEWSEVRAARGKRVLVLGAAVSS